MGERKQKLRNGRDKFKKQANKSFKNPDRQGRQSKAWKQAKAEQGGEGTWE